MRAERFVFVDLCSCGASSGEMSHYGGVVAFEDVLRVIDCECTITRGHAAPGPLVSAPARFGLKEIVRPIHVHFASEPVDVRPVGQEHHKGGVIRLAFGGVFVGWERSVIDLFSVALGV